VVTIPLLSTLFQIHPGGLEFTHGARASAKDIIMSTEVTLQGAPQVPNRAAVADLRPVAAPAADATVVKPAVKSVQKPAVDFDPKESQRKLSEAIAHLNEMMRSTGTNLNFSRDEALNQVVITVKNTETGKVIRQIPDVTFLKIAHNVESLKGLLHNQEI
jgi:flagellar protein FlaG